VEWTLHIEEVWFIRKFFKKESEAVFYEKDDDSFLRRINNEAHASNDRSVLQKFKRYFGWTGRGALCDDIQLLVCIENSIQCINNVLWPTL